MAAWMRSRLIPASWALPFHNRQRRRSTSSTITACRCALWVVGRQAAGDLRQVLQTHGDVEPVKNREATDAGLEEDASQPGAAVGERGQRRILCPPNRVEVAADQRREIRVGLRDGTEHLPASR